MATKHSVMAGLRPSHPRDTLRSVRIYVDASASRPDMTHPLE